MMPVPSRHDYGFDVGHLHVIDYHLWRELHRLPPPNLPSRPYLRFNPNAWTTR